MATTNTIAWHQECLINMQLSNKHFQKEIDSLQARIDMLNKDIILREKQIAKAISMGKTEFDGERFGRNL